MKCVECLYELPKLYEEPVKGNMTLVICPSCGKTADKYIEYEYTLIFLNLILCKSQVYRHILFNIEFCDTKLDIFKLFLLGCFMDCILYSCDNSKCWMIQFLRSFWINSSYLMVILLGSRFLGLKSKKLSIFRAILVASFGKLGSFMIVTWKYTSLYRGMMSFFIYLNNIISIKECLNITYFKAFALIAVAFVLSSVESTFKYYAIYESIKLN
jgi:lipid intermediate transporter